MTNLPRGLAFFSLFLSLSALAAPKPKVDPQPLEPVASEKAENAPLLTSGHWNLGGGFTLQKNSGARNDSTQFNLSARAERFFFDRVSLGGSASMATESGFSAVAALGPSTTWHYFTGGNYALYLGGEALFGITSATVDAILTARTGINAFLLPSIAFGPSLFFSHIEANPANYHLYGVAFGFDLYL